GQLLRLGATLYRASDLCDGDLAFADRLIELIRILEAEFADELGQRDAVDRQTLHFALEDLPSLGAVLLFVLLAEPGAHLAAIARRDEIAERGHQPVAARIGLLGRDDLDLVAVGQRLIQRHHAPV